MGAYLQIIGRSAAVYVFMVLAIRLFGKKELSQLSTTDLVFIVLISNSVQNAMVGADSSLPGGILAASVLFVMNYILKQFMYRSKKFKDIIEDKPVILVHDGHVDQQHLDREKITIDELEQAVREHGVVDSKHVKLAVLEVDGSISVISESGSHLKRTHFKRRRRQKTVTEIP
jgi:uncharacterized membrane protein YcaP (DUF421 family)